MVEISYVVGTLRDIVALDARCMATVTDQMVMELVYSSHHCVCQTRILLDGLLFNEIKLLISLTPIITMN
jgi:hypothetical protein